MFFILTYKKMNVILQIEHRNKSCSTVLFNGGQYHSPEVIPGNLCRWESKCSDLVSSIFCNCLGVY